MDYDYGIIWVSPLRIYDEAFLTTASKSARQYPAVPSDKSELSV